MAFKVRSDERDPRSGASMPLRAWDGPTCYDFGAAPHNEMPLDSDVAQRLVTAYPQLRIVGMDHEIASTGTVIFRSKTGQYTRERPREQMIDGRTKKFYDGCEWTASMEHIRWMIDRLAGDPEIEFVFPETLRGAQPPEPPMPTNPWLRLQHVAYNQMQIPRVGKPDKEALMRAMYVQDPELAVRTFDACAYRFALDDKGVLVIDPPDDLDAPKATGGAGAVRA